METYGICGHIMSFYDNGKQNSFWRQHVYIAAVIFWDPGCNLIYSFCLILIPMVVCSPLIIANGRGFVQCCSHVFLHTIFISAIPPDIDFFNHKKQLAWISHKMRRHDKKLSFSPYIYSTLTRQAHLTRTSCAEHWAVLWRVKATSMNKGWLVFCLKNVYFYFCKYRTLFLFIELML